MESKKNYKLWNKKDVSDWLANQLGLAQYLNTFGKCKD